MTIAQRIGRAADDYALTERKAEFFQAVRCLMLGARNSEVLQVARQRGVSERVVDYLTKAATLPITTGDTGIAPHTLASAFVAGLVGQSIFDTVLPFTVQVPPRSTVVAVSSGFTGSGVAEASAKPASRLSIGASDLDPTKCVGQCIITSELAKFGGTLADRLIRSASHHGGGQGERCDVPGRARLRDEFCELRRYINGGSRGSRGVDAKRANGRELAIVHPHDADDREGMVDIARGRCAGVPDRDLQGRRDFRHSDRCE